MDNVTPSPEVKTKNITFGFLVSWIIGVFLTFTGVVTLFSEPLTGLLFILASLVILPPAYQYLTKKFHLNFSRGVRIVLAGALLVAAGGTIDKPQAPTPPVTHKEVPVSVPAVVAATSTATPAPATVPAAAPKPKAISPAPTPIAVPVQKSYHTIFTFSGNGAKKSEPFTITGDRFKISYDCTGDICQAFLYQTNGKPKDLIMNTTGTTKDETIIYGKGEYYINANVIGSYTMTVQDYR